MPRATAGFAVGRAAVSPGTAPRVCEGRLDRTSPRGAGDQQGAMMEERDMIQVIMRIIGIERSPSAISALHPEDPISRPINRLSISGSVETVESKTNRGSIVEIGVIRVIILKGPAAGRDV